MARSLGLVAIRNAVNHQRALFFECKVSDICWLAQIPRVLAFAADAVSIMISRRQLHIRTCWASLWMTQLRECRRSRYLDRLPCNGSIKQWLDQSLTEPIKEIEGS